MNKEKIINELLQKHHIKLKEDDPIFALLFLNNITLQEYFATIETSMWENINNIAIKEDVTILKLQKLIEDSHARNNKVTERILNQFSDNLQSKIHAINQEKDKNNSQSWLWFTICLLGGFLGGLLIFVLM